MPGGVCWGCRACCVCSAEGVCLVFQRCLLLHFLRGDILPPFLSAPPPACVLKVTTCIDFDPFRGPLWKHLEAPRGTSNHFEVLRGHFDALRGASRSTNTGGHFRCGGQQSGSRIASFRYPLHPQPLRYHLELCPAPPACASLPSLCGRLLTCAFACPLPALCAVCLSASSPVQSSGRTFVPG